MLESQNSSVAPSATRRKLTPCHEMAYQTKCFCQSACISTLTSVSTNKHPSEGSTASSSSLKQSPDTSGLSADAASNPPSTLCSGSCDSSDSASELHSLYSAQMEEESSGDAMNSAIGYSNNNALWSQPERTTHQPMAKLNEASEPCACKPRSVSTHPGWTSLSGVSP